MQNCESLKQNYYVNIQHNGNLKNVTSPMLCRVIKLRT